MKTYRKISIVIALTIMAAVCAVIVACESMGKMVEFKFLKTPPTQVFCGDEVYFKEYIPLEFTSDYTLYASYYDTDKNIQIVDEERDSLLFVFENVSEHKFTVKRSDGKVLSCEIICIAEKPKISEVSEYHATLGETILLEDLFFWCGLSLQNEAAQKDPEFAWIFSKVTKISPFVNGSNEEIDLAGETEFTFDDEAVYEFEVIAENDSGSVTVILTCSTIAAERHFSEITGYVFTGKTQLVFEMEFMPEPANGGIVKTRLGNSQFDAVFSSATGRYTISDFSESIESGVAKRLYVTSPDGLDYSTNIVIPDLVLSKATLPAFETMISGYIIMDGDLDMSEVSNWGSNRTGDYGSSFFRGVFDGRGYTISNFTTGTGSYAGGLFWSVENTMIKNLIVKNAIVGSNNSVLSGRTRAGVTFKNIAIEVASMSMQSAGAINGPTESGITYTNVLVYVRVNSAQGIDRSGFFGGLYARKVVFDNVYAVSSTFLPITPPLYNTIETVISGAYTKYTALEGKSNLLSGGLGTVLLDDAAQIFFSGDVEDDPEDPNATYILTQATVDKLLKAKSATYELSENIDLTGISWNSSSNFSGVLDGKGYTIAGLTGSLFYKVDQAVIKNLVLKDVTANKRGVISAENIAGDITLENVAVNIVATPTTWTSLLGYQVGGTATLKDVFVSMHTDASNASYRGFLTCHAGAKQILQNVYCVGNIELHSTSATNHATYIPSYFKADGTIAAVKGADYYIFGTVAAFKDAAEYDNIPKAFKDAVDSLFTVGAIEITQANIGILQTATVGEYKLTENIDLSQITWSPTSTFTGVLDGDGYTVTGLKTALFKNVNGAVIKNLILKDVTVSKGVIAADNISDNFTLENIAVEIVASVGTWASLLGYQMGGTAMLKDVFVFMYTNASNVSFRGFLTCHAGAKQILENVYCVGNVELHSTNSGNHATLKPSYFKADGMTDAVKGTDYFIYATVAAFEGSNEYEGASGTVKDAVDSLFKT